MVSSDEKDMLREVRLLFVRANILNRRFGMCSVMLNLLCFGHSVFVSMAWHCGRDIALHPFPGFAPVILSV